MLTPKLLLRATKQHVLPSEKEVQTSFVTLPGGDRFLIPLLWGANATFNALAFVTELMEPLDRNVGAKKNG
jgi:hypothetical protein